MKTVPGFENIPCEQQKSYLKNAAAHSPGIKNDQVIEYYNKWAKKYEQVNLFFTTLTQSKRSIFTQLDTTNKDTATVFTVYLIFISL